MAALEDISSGYYFSCFMRWNNTETCVGVFENPELCATQIFTLRLLKAWRKSRINNNLEYLSSEKADDVDGENGEIQIGEPANLLPISLIVIAEIALLVDEIELMVVSDPIAVNKDNDDENSETFDLSLISSDVEASTQPPSPQNRSILSQKMLTAIDHILLVLTANATFNSKRISQSLSEKSHQVISSLKMNVMRILRIIELCQLIDLTEFGIVNRRISQTVCLLMHLLIEESGVAAFAQLFKEDELFAQLIKMSRVPFSKKRIDCKVAISAMAFFSRSAAIMYPQVSRIHCILLLSFPS